MWGPSFCNFANLRNPRYALSFFCTFGFGASSVTIGARYTAIYGHCDVLQGTEGAPQRPQISRSVDKKSLHDMIGKLFALELLTFVLVPQFPF